MRRLVLAFFFLLSFLVSFTHSVQAIEPQPHVTLIINQVRGTECCGAGGVNELKHQVETLQKLQLPAGFAVRYDALSNPEMVRLLKQAERSGAEVGAFLEITPQLARDAGVEYAGSPEQWYEAGNAYTIGYAPEDRTKLIDTYIQRFQQTFGNKPLWSVGWIVDTPTLKYLKEQHGLLLHEITREQWGTDSYTLYGGPPHLPYQPSENWALMPDPDNTSMPLIVRQTIADPVWNYGDRTNSRTSQPNDYALKDRGFPYFEHLFNQAHSQPDEAYTFALIGLENSMPSADQREFAKQLSFVADWKNNGPNRSILTPSAFARSPQSQSSQALRVLEGKDDLTAGDKAWWITTETYRARVRLENGTLSLTDLRLYDDAFHDPYESTSAGRIAYWVVPFALDGSRFHQNDDSGDFQVVAPDNLVERRSTFKPPTRILLAENLPGEVNTLREGDSLQLVYEGKLLARFAPETFWLNSELQSQLSHPFLTPLNQLIWKNQNREELWGFKQIRQDTLTAFQPFVEATNTELNMEREQRYPLLLPEAKQRTVSAAHSNLHRNNQVALAGRNPVRLVLFPRDASGFPVLTDQEPQLQSEPSVESMRFEKPHGANGMIFIDFENSTPLKSEVTIQLGEFTQTLPIYFAPNCKQQWQWCLTHPNQIVWYLRNWWGDKQRAREQAQQE